MSNETDPKKNTKASEDSPPAPTQDKPEAAEGGTAPSERENQDKSNGVTTATSEQENKDKATGGGTVPTIKENNDIAIKGSAVSSEQDNKDKATGGTALSERDSKEGSKLSTEQDNKDKAYGRRTSLTEQDNKEILIESPLVPKQENQEEAGKVTNDGAESCDCAQTLIAKLVANCPHTGEPRFSLRLKLPAEPTVENPPTPTEEPTEKLKSSEDSRTDIRESRSSLRFKLPAEPMVENPPTPTEEPTENQQKTEEKEIVKKNSN